LLYSNCDVFLRQGRGEKAQGSEDFCDHGLWASSPTDGLCCCLGASVKRTLRTGQSRR
jgi:hypothetical protein